MKLRRGGFAAAAAILFLTASCNRTTATRDNRVDKEANERAAQVSNSTDNKEGESAGKLRDDDRRATATTGSAEPERGKSGAASDGLITTKLQAKFVADKVVKARKIEVDTKDGIVTLKGTVASKLEHDRAEEIAHDTDGVKQVLNNLMVDPNVSERNDNHSNK